MKNSGFANNHTFTRAHVIKTLGNGAYEQANESLHGMRSVHAQPQDEEVYGSDVENYTEDDGEQQDWNRRYKVVDVDESQDGSDIELCRGRFAEREHRRADEEDAYASGSDITPYRGTRHPDRGSPQSPPSCARSSDDMEASDIEDVASNGSESGSESGSEYAFVREGIEEEWVGSDVCSIERCSSDGGRQVEDWIGSDVCSVEACGGNGDAGDCKDGEHGSKKCDAED